MTPEQRARKVVWDTAHEGPIGSSKWFGNLWEAVSAEMTAASLAGFHEGMLRAAEIASAYAGYNPRSEQHQIIASAVKAIRTEAGDEDRSRQEKTTTKDKAE